MVEEVEVEWSICEEEEGGELPSAVDGIQGIVVRVGWGEVGVVRWVW